MEEILDSLVIVDALYVYQVFQSHKKGRPDFVKMHHWVKQSLAKKADEELKPKYYYITSGLSDKTPVMKKLKKYYIVPELNSKSERSKCPKCSHKLDWGRQSDVDTEIALCLLEQGLLDPNIKTIVLFAGDGDFFRLLTRITTETSKTVIVVGDKSSSSSKLQTLVGKNYVQIPYEELVFSKAAAASSGSSSGVAAGGAKSGKYKLKGAAKSYSATADVEDEESKMDDEENSESLDDSLESGEDSKEEESLSAKTSRAASFTDDNPKYLKNSIMKVEPVAKPKKAPAESRASRATSVPIPLKTGKKADAPVISKEDAVVRRSFDDEEDTMDSVAHIAHGVLKMLDFEDFTGSAGSSYESSDRKLLAAASASAPGLPPAIGASDRKHSADEFLRFSKTEFSRDGSSLGTSWTNSATWTTFSTSLEDIKKSKPRVF